MLFFFRLLFPFVFPCMDRSSLGSFCYHLNAHGFYQCEPGHPQTLARLKVQKHLLHCYGDESICKHHSPKIEIFKNRRYPKTVAPFKQEVQMRHNKFELRRSTRVLHKTSFCLNVFSLNHS